MKSSKKLSHRELYEFLEEKHDRYNRKEFIASDPISIPHQFSKKEDIEIAAFFVATIAWGQRPTTIANASKLMQMMDESPHDFVLNFSENDLKTFEKFKHRTFNGTDCIFFLRSLKNIYTRHKSLENIFTPYLRKSETGGAARNAILKFRDIFFSVHYPARTQKHISNPAENSAAKRLNMFLRWMVRSDKRGVDFGIWKNFSPADLMCPLDVHSGNTARKLGLLQRKQNDWKAVEELTSVLRRFDSNDPVKYDFALFGLGVFEKFR